MLGMFPNPANHGTRKGRFEGVVADGHANTKYSMCTYRDLATHRIPYMAHNSLDAK